MQEQGGRRSPGLPTYERCRGACGALLPASGLGSDGRCLDCRLEPLRQYVPPLSTSKRLKREGVSWMEHQRRMGER